jgi:hypothetical protein
MPRITRPVRLLLTIASAVSAFAGALTSAQAQEHVFLGEDYIAHVSPSGYNLYTTSALELTFDLSYEPKVTKAKTVCGNFMAEIMYQAYPELNPTPLQWGTSVIYKLTNMKHPTAQQWHWAITSVPTRTYTNNLGVTYSLPRIASSDDWQEGDLIAAAYTPPGSSITGHAMIIASLPVADGAAAPGGTTSLSVTVLDSTSSTHSNDSRTSGQGIGEGDLRVYVDAAGDLVWWQWSLYQPGKLFYNGASVPDGVCPAAGSGFGACEARPIAVGRLTFPNYP